MRCLGNRSKCWIGIRLLLAYLLVAFGCYYVLWKNASNHPQVPTWFEAEFFQPRKDENQNNNIHPLKQKASVTAPTVAALPRIEDYLDQTAPQQSATLEYLDRKLDSEQGTGGDTTTEGYYSTSFLETPIGNSTTYQQLYCNLQGEDWCPSGEDGWQKNAPYLMIIGVKKAGTTSLWTSLVEDHPLIVAASTPTKQMEKELLFFSQNRFPTDVYLDSNVEGGRVKVQSIRRNYHQQLFSKVHASQDVGAISLDVSPQYLVNWPIATRPILCSSPWVKLLVIVRNPTDRLWSHYQFIRKSTRKKSGKEFKLSFDEWIQKDLTIMSRLGLIDGVKIKRDGNTPTLSGNSKQHRLLSGGRTVDGSTRQLLSDEELSAAWSNYTRRITECPVGRGFYALHLYQWFQELRRLGRDPHEAFKIVRLEDLKDDNTVTSQVLNEIYEWLELPPPVTTASESKSADGVIVKPSSAEQPPKRGLVHRMNTEYDGPDLSETTRDLLDAFYAPYNKMLSRLLGDNRWEYRRKTTDSETDAVVWPRNDKTNDALFRLPTEASKLAVPCGGRYTGSLGSYNGSISENMTSVDKKTPSFPSFFYQIEIPQSDQSPILKYLRTEWATDSFHTTNDEDSSNKNLPMSALYQQQQCDLEGGEWCPSSADSAWQMGAPHFMIIGEKKSGTTSFFMFMNKHPNILPGVEKELMFFNQRKFMKFPQYVDAGTGRIKVQTVRKDLIKLYPKLAEWTRKTQSSNSTTRSKRISYDATPQYLYNWASSAKQVLCTCPWVKLLVIVRNPTDRLWSHYNYVNAMVLRHRNYTMTKSFEQWIEEDMRLLVKFGLIEERNGQFHSKAIVDDTPHRTDPERQTLTESEMAEAWSKYTMVSGEGPVGRGFYALSIYQWFKELRRIGRDPLASIKIIRLEDVKDNEMAAAQIFDEITDWLGLSSSSSLSSETTTTEDRKKARAVDFVHAQKTNYNVLGKPVLADSTRDMLDQFYAPYNHMLSQLLGDDGWEYSRPSEDSLMSSKFETENRASLDDMVQNDRVVVWPRRLTSKDEVSPRFFRDHQHDGPSICDNQKI
jgi:hypothetical protein